MMPITLALPIIPSDHPRQQKTPRPRTIAYEHSLLFSNPRNPNHTLAKSTPTFASISWTATRSTLKFTVLTLTLEARSWWRVSGLTLATDWDTFRDQFEKRFTPPDAIHAARRKLTTVTQGKRSVATYTSEFRSCTRLIPKIDDGTILFEFLRGLDPATSTQVRLLQPKTLDEAITHATIIHSILHPTHPQDLPTQPTPPPPTSGPTPMDLDSMHVFMAQMAALFQGANATNINAFGRYNQLPKKLTPEIRAELIRTGACFRCRCDVV
ncbi:hypothetical protein EMPS_06758 [Entomortierella parvispora]|uniref:Retrotransposon gag domain-containing protein n=1 Tax=Entomortierella parvispora TaxID=205924 RepID=A0A9P3HCW4_9FUNG|nr:hypothetical protein EMPS_06758 [Entomortierella parvispora]